MSATVLPTGTDFSVPAVVHTIYRTVVHETYFGCTNADPGNSAGLALQLHKHIRHSVNQLRRRNRGFVADWEAHSVVNGPYYGYDWAISTTLRPNPAYATSRGEALGMRYGRNRNYDRKYCSHGPHTTVSGL